VPYGSTRELASLPSLKTFVVTAFFVSVKTNFKIEQLEFKLY
jgi:hypothetical protein